MRGDNSPVNGENMLKHSNFICNISCAFNLKEFYMDYEFYHISTVKNAYFYLLYIYNFQVIL